MLTLPLGHTLSCHCKAFLFENKVKGAGYQDMRKRICAVLMLLFIILVFSCAFLQFRGSQLDEEFVSELIDRTEQKYGIPAISVSVMNSEKVCYTVSDGVKAYGESTPIGDGDYFHIGSCSKSVLSFIAAKLIEDGLLSWDTRFFDICPELRDGALQDYSGITLEDLLSCRAGIQPYTSGLESYPDLSESQDRQIDFIRYLLSLPPASERNDSGKFAFRYSNASYTPASAMLEKVSGLSWEDLLEKYIVRELGIPLFIGWPYEKSPDQPIGHLPGSGSAPTVVGPDSGYTLNPLVWPSGNLSMTADGFNTYIQLHLRALAGTGDGADSDAIRYMDTKYSGFSLGAWNGTDSGKYYVCLDGTAGTYYARGLLIPDSDFGFAILMNCGSEDAAEYMTRQLMKAHYNWWWMFWI
jgi:D-alanyl-D-alanine carboxypeptidase